jgi:hypothetical protein
MNLHNDSIPDRQDHACGLQLRQQTLDFISKPCEAASRFAFFKTVLACAENWELRAENCPENAV